MQGKTQQIEMSDLILMLGEKDVQIALLRKRLRELESEVKAIKPTEQGEENGH